MHSIDTNTFAGQTNNQAMTHQDLDILAQNLTNAFTKEIRAIVSANNAIPQQLVLAKIATQIKNLKERIEPSEDVSTHHKSDDGETKISRLIKKIRQEEKDRNYTRV